MNPLLHKLCRKRHDGIVRNCNCHPLLLFCLALLLAAGRPAAANGSAVSPSAWRLDARLAPDPAAPDLAFGYAVAIHSAAIHGAATDGAAITGALTAAVGALGAHPLGGESAGAVYIYTQTTALIRSRPRSSASHPTHAVGAPGIPAPGWTLQARLVPTDSHTADRFGVSLALQEGVKPSGDTLLVGAMHTNTTGQDGLGAAYLFTRANGAWTPTARLAHPDQHPGDLFGQSVALDGDTLLVGAPNHTIDGQPRQGAAYLFTRANGVWAPQARLTAPGQDFGWSVALDGDTALVGALQAEAGAAITHTYGAAYVFTRTGATWTQQARLTAPALAPSDDFDSFGWSVSLNGDTALVGDPHRDQAGQVDQGAAYLFTRAGSAWDLSASLAAPDGAARHVFGAAVALEPAAPPTLALVGAPGVPYGNGVRGSAYICRSAAGAAGGASAWSCPSQSTLAPPGNPPGLETYGGFGLSVALAGGYLLVGFPFEDTPAAVDPGAAYLFAPGAQLFFPLLAR